MEILKSESEGLAVRGNKQPYGLNIKNIQAALSRQIFTILLGIFTADNIPWAGCYLYSEEGAKLRQLGDLV